MSANGRLRADELKPVQGSIVLATAAADAYIALRADIVRMVGMAPVLSLNGGYRSYADQVKLSGKGYHQYKPGNSVHGWGTCVDINNWQRIGPTILDQVAAVHGFRRTIPTERWHYQFFGTPAPAPIAPPTETETNMLFLHVKDNGGPLWTVLNTSTGQGYQIRDEANAQSWAQSLGAPRYLNDVQALLDAIALVELTTGHKIVWA